MDSMTLIAIVSIITAGVTIATGEYRTRARRRAGRLDGLELAGTTARCLEHHHTNLVRGPGDDRIHRHLLSRDLDDFDLRQPVLAPRH